MKTNVPINQLHDEIPNVGRVLLWSDTTCPYSVVKFVKQVWPESQILGVAKKKSKEQPRQIKGYHEYCRKSPTPVLMGIRLIARLRRMRWDAFLLKKYELSIKLLLSIIILRPRQLLLWRETSDEVSLSELRWSSLLLMPFQKKYFLLSFVAMLLPLSILFLQLPLVLLNLLPWVRKKEILLIIKNNIVRGPMADSPWLFGWLQVIMAHTFMFGKERNNNKPSRILVIRVDHIGDSINTVPLTRHLRKLYQNAKITIMCDTSSFIWENCPYIDEVLLYKTNNPLLNRGRKRLTYALRPFTFVPELRKRKFDLVIDPVGRTETHLISYLCLGAHRISSTYYPYQLFDTTVAIRHYETNSHETRRSLALLKPIDKINEADCQLEFWFKPETRNKAQKILATNHIEGDNMLLGIHPGAKSPLRRWPIERMATVAHSLTKKYGMDIIFFEPPDNKEMTSSFTAHLAGLRAKIAVIRGIDLNLLTALIAECNLFICNDSGPMHLAAATKTPMIAIFGPGEYTRWQPLHSNSVIARKPFICSPCSQNDCRVPKCLLQVETSDVMRAAEIVLRKSEKKAFDKIQIL